jgi:hypothetical protein
MGRRRRERRRGGPSRLRWWVLIVAVRLLFALRLRSKLGRWDVDGWKVSKLARDFDLIESCPIDIIIIVGG